MKAIKPETVNFLLAKKDIVHDIRRFMTEPIEEIMKEIVNIARKV